MGSRLREMIRSIRACKTAAEERAVVAKECAILRDKFKDPDQYYRHRNVAKLMFIHMLGYPTHFGQMECIKLIAASDFAEKRIGYLGLMVLLDERQEVLMLVTNSVKNRLLVVDSTVMNLTLGSDLNHANQHVAGLALCALGNICTSEMAQDLSAEVEKLLQDNNAYIRKKAALCAVRIVRKVPDLVESFTVPASNLLMDKHHGVLVAGVKLCIELCQASDAALEHFRKQISSIVRLLRNLVLSGYVSEYDVTGITDPLLQINLLKLLRFIGKGDSELSDIMSDVLAQVATSTEGTKNAGKAILYECVRTIMAIEDIGGLRALAINILGRFLATIDNNIRYVALNTLAKVVAVDSQAVQRHRTIIVNCIKDSDISIRARALELVVNLVNETNVKALSRELLEYLKVSDPEFKVDLTAKIGALVQKFAPTKLWYIDQIILLMVEAGMYVDDGVVRSLVVVVGNAPEIQGYAVRKLYRAFQDWSGQECLAQVTVWCIGEYGDMLVNNSNELEGEDPQTVTESDAVDAVESVLRDDRVSATAVAFSLTAVLKMSFRFPQCTERINALLKEYSRSLNVELQQRSVEFGSILTRHYNLKGSLLERMPVLDLESYSAKYAEVDGDHDKRSESPVATTSSTAPASTKVNKHYLMDLLTFHPKEQATPLSNSAGDALLKLLGSIPTPTTNASSSSALYSAGGASALLDILALGEQPEPTSIPERSSPSTALRKVSTVTEIQSTPLLSHRLSTLGSDPTYPHKKTLEEDFSLRSKRVSLIESAQPQQRSNALLDDKQLTGTVESVVEPTVPVQRTNSILDDIPLASSRTSIVAKQPTLPPRPRRTTLIDDLPVTSSRISIVGTESTTTQHRRSSLLNGIPVMSTRVSTVDTELTTAQQRRSGLMDDRPLTNLRVSVAATEHTEAQQRRNSLLDDLYLTSNPVSSTGNQQQSFPQNRRSLIDDDIPLRTTGLPVLDIEPMRISNWRNPVSVKNTIADDLGHPLRPNQSEPSAYAPIVALQTEGLRVDFGFTNSPDSPQTTLIKATFTNTSPAPYIDFVFQAAVPKFMTLRLDPASSSFLPARSSGVITQNLTVTNNMHGQGIHEQLKSILSVKA